MVFDFVEMNEQYANEVVQWHYEGNFTVYDSDNQKASIEELYNKSGYDLFVAIDNLGDLIGFLECTIDQEEELEFSCFLNPELVGQGLGYDFITACVEFSVEHFDYIGEKVKVTIESFNERAIKVFKRVGFIVDDEREQWDNSGDQHWVELVLYL